MPEYTASYDNQNSNIASQASQIINSAVIQNNLILQASGKLPQGLRCVDRAIDSLFTGQEHVLRKLKKKLCKVPDAEKSRRRVFVLHGLAGFGKSEVCLEFIERNKDRFWGVFWIDAGDDVQAKVSFARIAAEVGLTSDLERDALKGKRLLGIQENWLLIIDNAGLLHDVREWFPPVNAGTIIITTRYQSLVTHATKPSMSYKMTQMDMKDGVDLLLAKAGEKVADEQSRTEGRHIVAELGAVPQALVQAGAIMRTSSRFGPRIPLEQYLAAFKSHKNNLMKEEISGYDDSVYSTWMLSRRRIETLNSCGAGTQTSLDALAILDVSSQFHSGDIACEVFRSIPGRGRISTLHSAISRLRASTILGRLLPHPDTMEWSRSRISGALSFLASYSFVDYDETQSQRPERFSVNKLVQTWTNSYLGNYCSEDHRVWARFAAFRCLVYSIRRSSRQHEHVTLRRQLYSHVDFFLRSHGDYQIKSSTDAHAAQEFSAVYSENGYYAKSESLLRKVLLWCEQNLPDNDPMIHEAATSLSVMLSRMALYKEAVKLSAMTLKNGTTHRGVLDPQTLRTRSSYGLALSGLGRFREARKVYAEVISISRDVLGDDHTVTLEAKTDMAKSLVELGDYDDAVKLSREVWEIWESREKRREKERQERLHRRSKDVTGVYWTRDSREALQSLSSLAHNLECQGKHLEEAEEKCKLCWEKHKVTLGARHPDTLDSLAQLARCQLKEGRISNAEANYTEVKEGRTIILGPSHPDTIIADIDLIETSLHGPDPDLTSAKARYEAALSTLIPQLAPNHPYILIIRSNLAVILRNQGDLPGAKNIYEELLSAYDSAGTPSSPDAHRCMVNLAVVLLKDGDLDSAESYGRRAVDGYTRTLGRGSRDTLKAMLSLARTLQKAGKYEEAATCARAAADGFAVVYGGTNGGLDGLEALSVLGSIEYWRRNDYEAESLLRRGCEGFDALGRHGHWCVKFHQIVKKAIELSETDEGIGM